jgi:hypothetical protein
LIVSRETVWKIFRIVPLCRSTPTFLPPQHPELGCKYPFHRDPETEDEAKHPDLVRCPEPDCLEQGRTDAEAESRDDTIRYQAAGRDQHLDA